MKIVELKKLSKHERRKQKNKNLIEAQNYNSLSRLFNEYSMRDDYL
jgi:hypothetical protein